MSETGGAKVRDAVLSLGQSVQGDTGSEVLTTPFFEM